MSGLVDKDGAPVGEDEIKKKDAEIAELKTQIAIRDHQIAQLRLENFKIEEIDDKDAATYWVADGSGQIYLVRVDTEFGYEEEG